MGVGGGDGEGFWLGEERLGEESDLWWRLREVEECGEVLYDSSVCSISSSVSWLSSVSIEVLAVGFCCDVVSVDVRCRLMLSCDRVDVGDVVVKACVCVLGMGLRLGRRSLTISSGTCGDVHALA